MANENVVGQDTSERLTVLGKTEMPAVPRALTLQDLPPPPPDRQGWPWTEQTDPLPDQMANGAPWPRITIVTPSFNQGAFLEETIRSVLLQGYPNLEYFILDGGSTDQSVDIIRKYAPHLTDWVSQPDGGQTAALCQGFQRATGELVGWQNSDDYYHPGCFRVAAEAVESRPEADILYGPTACIDASGHVFRDYPVVETFTIASTLPFLSACNQAMFFRQRIFAAGHFPDPDWHHAMDHEFLVRLALNQYQFCYVPEVQGYFRYHADAKGNRTMDIAIAELLKLYGLIYQHPHLSGEVHQKAAACMRSLCLDAFSKLRLQSFRQGVRTTLNITGIHPTDLPLLLKYGLSWLGNSPISASQRLKQMWQPKTA